ncbi:hypothetical protein [Galbibacter sp. BG1]
MKIVGKMKLDNINLYDRINVDYEVNEKENVVEIEVIGKVIFNYQNTISTEEIKNNIKNEFNYFFTQNHPTIKHGMDIKINPFKCDITDFLLAGDIKIYLVLQDISEWLKMDIEVIKIHIDWLVNNLIEGHIIIN